MCGGPSRYRSGMCPSLRCASVAASGLGPAAGRAVAFVAHTHRVGGGGGAADRGVDGVQALVVPLGGVTGVDGLVAEAVVLGSGKASLLTRVEGHGEARHEEAEAPLRRRWHRERKSVEGMVEPRTVASGRRIRKAPAPAWEQEMRRVASRRGTVAPICWQRRTCHRPRACRATQTH